MARRSEPFHLAWGSLASDAADAGWRVISLDSAGPLRVRAGRRTPDDAEAVLVGFATVTLPSAEKLPEGQGFTIERADPEGDGRLWLALTRKSSGSRDVFADMVCNVIAALDHCVVEGANERRLLRVFLGRVRAWQQFMRQGLEPLGPDAEVGLFGELEVLCSILNSGVSPAAAVRAWIGPLDGTQDFDFGMGALEVKSTLAGNGFTVTIGSLEQLDDSRRQPLFVVAARLRQAHLGCTLPEKLAAVRARMEDDREAVDLLAERVLAARYLDSHADSYVRRFELAEMSVLEVRDPFPRLTPANVPLGVVRAMYDLDLDKVPAPRHALPAALRKLGVL